MLNNRKDTNLAKNSGFTLVETMVAIFILTVGIFALYSLHVTSIRYNASANAMSSSSTWAADRIEQLLEVNYANLVNGNAVSPDGRYAITWNVNNVMTPNPANLADSTVRAIRITVQHNELGIMKQVVLNYYKQRIF